MKLGKQEGTLPIKLHVLTVSNEHAEFFAKPDPAIFTDEEIFLLHYDSTKIISFKREKGKVDIYANPNQEKHHWTCVETEFSRFGDYGRLMEQSLFYRTKP